MAITLELPPEEEQSLRRRAEMAGQDVTTYLLIGAGIRIPALAPLSNEEWGQLLDQLADIVPADVSLLSDYAVSREGIYEERDAELMRSASLDPARV